MGKYTLQNDKKIDTKIQQDMDTICEEILKNSTPISILLTGSFGRGEGSVLVIDHEIIPLRDYDILVVMEETLPERVLKDIEGKIYDRLGYSRPETREFLFSDFAITVYQTTPGNIRSYANVGSYEIKTKSTLLYGNEIRDIIPLTLNEIPVASGLHFLFTKSVELLGYFSTTYLTEPPKGKEKIFLIYECGKAYIEMATALSILGGFYRPGYKQRNELFQTEFTKLFGDLEKKSSTLPEKINFYTSLKLYPDLEVFDTIDPVALWFETRDDLLSVLDYYMVSWYGQRSGPDTISLSKSLYSCTKNDYFQGQLQYFLRVHYGINNQFVATGVNYFYQRYTALEFYFRLKKERRNTLHVLMESPILKIFSLAPVLLASLSQNGQTNQQYLHYFHSEFRKIVFESQVSNLEHDWDYARSILVTASRTYNRLR